MRDRTTIEFPAGTKLKLKYWALEDNCTVGHLVREAIAKFLWKRAKAKERVCWEELRSLEAERLSRARS
jgi:hypothetical protein